MYFDTDMRQVTSTYLSLVEMKSCDAEVLTNAVKTTLHNKGLDIKKFVWNWFSYDRQGPRP